MIFQKLKSIAGPDLWNVMKTRNCRSCWKPSILLPKVVRPCWTGYDIGRADLKLSWLIALPFRWLKIIAGLDLSNVTKNWKWQTFPKPSIFFLRAVSTTLTRSLWQLGWLVIDNSLVLLYSKNYRSGPMKYEGKSNFSNLLETIHTTSHSGQTMFNRLCDVGWIDFELTWLTVLTFIWYSKNWKLLQVRTCQVWRKYE